MAKIDDYIAEVAAQYPNPIVNDGGVDRFMTEEEKFFWAIRWQLKKSSPRCLEMMRK